jgi:hypothetical protein
VAEAELLGKIAQTRLRHRLFAADGKMGYLLEGDRIAVELDETVWQAVSAEYDDIIGRASKRLKLAFTLTMPVIIATLVVIENVAALKDLADRIDRSGWGGLLVLVVVTWLPLAGLLVHARATSRARQHLEAQLAHLPHIAVPGTRPKLHQELQIVAMIFVGPAILVRAVGTLFPDIYRNTPLSGTHIGWFDLIAALALLAWFATRPARQ